MWLATCEATRLRRKRKAKARLAIVVDPSKGLMPTTMPKASEPGEFAGAAADAEEIDDGGDEVALKERRAPAERGVHAAGWLAVRLTK